MADEPTPTPQGGGNPTPTPEAPKTLTQEQVDKIVQERLARDREAREKEAEAERKRIEDEKKSEIEKLASQIAELQKQLEEEKSARAKSELTALRTRIGKAAELPDELVDLLQGDDEESLKAHAEKLKAVVGGKKEGEPEEPQGPMSRPKEKLRPGASNDGDDAPDYEKIAERIASRNTF